MKRMMTLPRALLYSLLSIATLYDIINSGFNIDNIFRTILGVIVLILMIYLSTTYFIRKTHK
jgi:hypothetical protein